MGEAETSHFDYRSRGTMNDDAAVHPPRFLADPTRFLFFTGKGGVGKTSVACAAALAHVDNGKSALLVSIDPASNLDEILDLPLGNLPIAVSGAGRLQVLNIDPIAAAESYRLRVMACPDRHGCNRPAHGRRRSTNNYAMPRGIVAQSGPTLVSLVGSDRLSIKALRLYYRPQPATVACCQA